MNQARVLISGAGIAGPALASWLARAGHRTTVVERAPALREGGQAVDFRGPVHRAVLERMDLWDVIHQHCTRAGELCLVGSDGAARATLPASMLSGDVEILRGDLCRLLYERTRGSTDYRFCDRIVRLEQHGGEVAVSFEHARQETFDIVVGADGLHSGVRALAFDNERTLRHHGYRIASFGLPNILDRARGGAAFSDPGRGVVVTAASRDEARALLVSTGGPMAAGDGDPGMHKRALAQRFAGMGWKVPEVLVYLSVATDLYVDAIATVHVDRYAKGRVVLLGDAAQGGTLGGQGTSLAIVGAYVLASELSRTADPETAFTRYEARMRPYAVGCQRGAMRAGQFLAPRTRFGVAMRNLAYRVLTSRALRGGFERLARAAASDFALPESQ
jgi:2-polyprenyl-6-methoxyphenol hydroxylase-like FAD-dependent oxidoreductase